MIKVLIGYVDIGDSSVNAHLCSLSGAFIVLHTNIARSKSVFPCRQFQCLKDSNSKRMQSRVVVPVLCTSFHSA